MQETDFDPSRLRPGWKTPAGDLKPGCVRPSYDGGTPAAGDLKPGLVDSGGNLKPGLVDGDDLKPSLRPPREWRGYPTTGVEEDIAGGEPWSSESNATGAPDGLDANSRGRDGDYSDWLVLSGFAPPIPSGVPVRGLTFRVTLRDRESRSSDVQIVAQPVINGARAGDEQTIQAALREWEDWSLVTFGGPSSLFGLTPKAGDSFGVALRVEDTPDDDWEIEVDAAEIVVAG